jgi:hypothetical protein
VADIALDVGAALVIVAAPEVGDFVGSSDGAGATHADAHAIPPMIHATPARIAPKSPTFERARQLPEDRSRRVFDLAVGARAA